MVVSAAGLGPQLGSWPVWGHCWSVIGATYSRSYHTAVQPMYVVNSYGRNPPTLFRMMVDLAVIAREGRNRILAVDRMFTPSGILIRDIGEE